MQPRNTDGLSPQTQAEIAEIEARRQMAHATGADTASATPARVDRQSVDEDSK